MKHLVIYGTGETAEMAYEYFSYDSPYSIVAFTVEKKFLKKKTFRGLPVVPFEKIAKRYPPKTHDMFIAISYTGLNRVRARYFALAKKKKYHLATYISTRAFIWRTAKIGENCMIFENNVIQHGVTIGNNVIVWSGNHIGHQAKVENHVFISSHCVISGYCIIGEYSFLGVNSTYNDHIVVAADGCIGSGAVVIKNTEKGRVYVGNPAKPLDKTSYDVFGVTK